MTKELTTEILTLEISRETADNIYKVVELDGYDPLRSITALSIINQLYSDLKIGDKGENNEDNNR